MMRFLIPLVIVLLGTGIGVGAGWFLAPDPPEAPECACDGTEEGGDGPAAEGAGEGAAAVPAEYEYVDLEGQFVVPIIVNDSPVGMMVMSLSLEMEPGARETAYAKVAKLRDEFLSVLFGYASIGGFAGNYLDLEKLRQIRRDLTEKAQEVLGPVVHEVLIIDMIRQDI